MKYKSIIFFLLFIFFALYAEENIDSKISTDNKQSPTDLKNKSYVSNTGHLRSFEFESERLVLSNNIKLPIIINSNENRTARKFYDSNMRVEKIEYWEIGAKYADSKKVSVEKFYYTENNITPYSSVVDAPDYRTETLYDDAGRIISLSQFFISENKNTINDSKTTFKYSDKNELLEKEVTLYEYENENKTKLKKMIVQKDVYEYVSKDIRPNHSYYEDGKLRIMTKYSDDDSYISTFYFDGDYVIIAEYVNGKKISETITSNGVNLRTTTYE